MRRGREARYRATGSDWAEHEATGLGDASDGFVGSARVSSDMGVLGAMGRLEYEERASLELDKEFFLSDWQQRTEDGSNLSRSGKGPPSSTPPSNVDWWCGENPTERPRETLTGPGPTTRVMRLKWEPSCPSSQCHTGYVLHQRGVQGPNVQLKLT